MSLDDGMATAPDLARMYGVPIGTIYRWASIDGWERTSPRHRPVRYRRGDADKSYFDRRASA
ncbi:hypothetical protein FLW53_09515 [Microbispora sp. SCL1-1]|uniref:hypothetical protein n=1 Tax=unclassified Microbispora TaxID=2614687 RepID=UPI00115BB1A7|nr:MULTISPECIES: hypothetical protein [unclassified Microbispora]NJP24441.1 hypothetical protein [Microbispora sp. CL1-1]TQS14588.1 hypothetical protein FLW53_09515 [Microbispora sp. SCL1-1]